MVWAEEFWGDALWFKCRSVRTDLGSSYFEKASESTVFRSIEVPTSLPHLAWGPRKPKAKSPGQNKHWRLFLDNFQVQTYWGIYVLVSGFYCFNRGKKPSKFSLMTWTKQRDNTERNMGRHGVCRQHVVYEWGRVLGSYLYTFLYISQSYKCLPGAQ